MRIAAVGDIHGQLDQMYEIVAELEVSSGAAVDLVLQVGDLGVWPDSQRIDSATQKHGDVGDFPAWYRSRRQAPVPTIFIAGNHEDFDFLSRQTTGALLPGLVFLRWGDVTSFQASGTTIRIGGVGGCYAESSYRLPSVTGARRRHYCRADLERLVQRREGAIDVLLFHDAPKGGLHSALPGFHPRTSSAEGLAECLASIRPRICFTGHWHMRTERQIAGVRTVGLNLLPRPGSVMLLELHPGQAEPTQLLEWGVDAGWVEFASPVAEETAPLELSPSDLTHELAKTIKAWAARVRSDGRQVRSLTHRDRKRVYAALAKRPDRAILLAALTDSDVEASIARTCDSSDHQALLAQWAAGDLPDEADVWNS